MTPDARPLTAEEEAQIRRWAALDSPLGVATKSLPLHEVQRLLATLAEARALPSTPTDQRLADCEDALATVEAAYDRDVPPSTPTDREAACNFDPYYCRAHDSERHSVVDDRCAARLGEPR